MIFQKKYIGKAEDKMKLEITLSKGKTEGMLKAELRIENIKPEEAYVSEFTEAEIIKLTKDFYRNLELMGIKSIITMYVKGDGIDQDVYQRIKKRISEEIPHLNAWNN